MINKSSIRIHQAGKIDIHNRQRNLRRALARIQDDNRICQENKGLIAHFIDDCLIGKTIIGKSKKKIGPATCLKYLSVLSKLAHVWGKSFDEITQRDMEGFVRDLEYDNIISHKGKPYSDETKIGIKKAIKKFWKWKDGNNRTYPDLVNWIDTFFEVKDAPALSRAEIKQMVEYTSSPRNKALIMILFDSGARIEELLNVRLKKEHLFWNVKNTSFMIRLEFSKTKPRTISLPFCTDVLNKWLLRHPAKDNPDAQLFPLSYGNTRMIIKRIGQRVLNKKVTPHMLRHCSATFYANKLNRYQLCYRYGWAMSSDMVNRYLDREGILEGETSQLVRTDELIKENKKNEVLREELSLIKESNSTLQAEVSNLKEMLDGLMGGREFMTLLTELTAKQKKMSEILKKISGDKFDLILPEKGKSILRTEMDDPAPSARGLIDS